MSDQEQPLFWSDQLAYGVKRKFEDQDTYVCASGISPSGHVHIGNFREIITTDFVVKSLQYYDEDTRFIYSWDDYDRFRKVPDNVPDEFEKYIGLPLSKVPDPEGCHESYAEHFEARLEEQLEDMHMDIEFIRQSKMFQKGEYADLIKKAMNNREKIKDILDQYRQEPLEEDWQPLRVYCKECGKDFTEINDYDGEYTVEYNCNECEEAFEINFKEEDSVKPPWRVDWPMRWFYENVSFEPGGKDHSAAGSSRDTGKQIIEEVYDAEAPVYQMYDFVRPKGSDKKISSSSGENVLTLDDMKEIYSPEMIRFLFSQTKPKKVINLAFDEEIIQIYDRFDRFEENYFGEGLDNEKKQRHQERVYELAMVELPDERPLRVPFKHAAFVAQTVPEDEWRSKGLESLRRTGHVPEDISEDEEQQVIDRLRRAKNWAREYAPEDYVYRINERPPEDFTDEEVETLNLIQEALGNQDFEDADELDGELWNVQDASPLEAGDFFEASYRAILGRESGPRLSTLIMSIGQEKSREILSKI
ncbi:lysine--tRNA ligase [Candidatus Nanosalina sp. VS9-1]|uniref:lysine--tRNA ligase n=1 Tax=Candidatus Nanosalina sp. VS9-1 TaxID=3388566 RepID=UPI0039DF582D